MPTIFGLDTLALIVSASVAAPSAGMIPDAKGVGPATSAVIRPACPDWFGLKSATPHKVVCTIAVPDQSYTLYQQIAQSTPCLPGLGWTGPSVQTTGPGLSRTHVVTWTCLHR